MSKPEAPAPTNPVDTAQAATGTNIGTAISNMFLNSMNQVGPDGTRTYDQTGSYQYKDPYTGQTYDIPRFTQTDTLSGAQSAIKGQNDQTKYNLASMGNQQSQKLSDWLSNPFSTEGAPAAGDASTISGVPGASTTFGDAGDIKSSYGPEDNFSSDRQRVEDSLMSRINPQLARERGNIEQRLADQGIKYGSPAYTAAMDDYNRQATDTRFGAIGAAGQEQQRMMDMAAQEAGFQNAAQQQKYTQELGRGTFGNASLAQQLAQAQQAFGAQNTSRSNWMNEQYAQRNQPINEITALMSGSQVSSPQFGATPQSQIPTTDVAGLINNQFNQQQQNYQQQNQAWQSTMGGILGLGGNAMKAYMMSDEREKESIDRIGTVFAASSGEAKKLPIYSYNYKKDPAKTRHVGPMAQDVEKVDPGAVREFGGRKHVDLETMGAILRAA